MSKLVGGILGITGLFGAAALWHTEQERKALYMTAFDICQDKAASLNKAKGLPANQLFSAPPTIEDGKPTCHILDRKSGVTVNLPVREPKQDM